MNFEDYLKNSATEIENQLKIILTDFVHTSKKTNNKLLPFAKALFEANIGGKRIRGVLCLLGYQLSKGKTKKEILKIASALEILHTALLIHDDIMDQSPQRRGKKALYQALGGNHYGISQAISIGDISFYLPIKLIADSTYPDNLKIKALSYLSQTIINTGWGQILDMKKPQDKKDLEFIRIFKTAKYTIAAPLQIGAMLAGADKKLVNKLGEFGESLGIAFQIQDDILDGEVKQSEHFLALKYTLKAKKMIPSLTDDSKMKNCLEQLSNYLVERTV